MSVLLADFFTQSMLWLIVTLAMLMHLCKKVAGSNSEVASAFKMAATKKALDFVGKLLK
jgi:hypothetical protein